MHMKRDLIMSSDGETKCQKKIVERKSAFSSFAKRHFFRSIGFRLIPRSQPKTNCQVFKVTKTFAEWSTFCIFAAAVFEKFSRMYNDISAFLLNQDDVLKKGVLCVWRTMFWMERITFGSVIFFVSIKKEEIEIKSSNNVGPFSLQFSSKNH